MESLRGRDHGVNVKPPEEEVRDQSSDVFENRKTHKPRHGPQPDGSVVTSKKPARERRGNLTKSQSRVKDSGRDLVRAQDNYRAAAQNLLHHQSNLQQAYESLQEDRERIINDMNSALTEHNRTVLQLKERHAEDQEKIAASEKSVSALRSDLWDRSHLPEQASDEQIRYRLVSDSANLSRQSWKVLHESFPDFAFDAGIPKLVILQTVVFHLLKTILGAKHPPGGLPLERAFGDGFSRLMEIMRSAMGVKFDVWRASTTSTILGAEVREVVQAESNTCHTVYKTVLQVLGELTDSSPCAQHKNELQQLVDDTVPFSHILASQIAPYRFKTARTGDRFDDDWMEHCTQGQQWLGQRVNCTVVR